MASPDSNGSIVSLYASRSSLAGRALMCLLRRHPLFILRKCLFISVELKGESNIRLLKWENRHVSTNFPRLFSLDGEALTKAL